MSVVELATRSARIDRLRALAPRVVLFGTLGFLSLAGLRAALDPAASTQPAHDVRRKADVGAMAFAEGFARAYLSYDSARPELRERALAAYLADDLDPDGGLTAGGSRTVSWTTVESGSSRGRRQTITVAAQTSAGMLHLAVPVERDRRGFLRVPAYPALVGAPATDTAARSPDEADVEDPRLRVVVERAVRNYLAGERRNLLADLAPEAVVSLPTQPLEVRSVAEITWARPGRIAAALVEARDAQGNRWTLRYELGVLRHDRWYVRSLHTDPTLRGGTS